MVKFIGLREPTIFRLGHLPDSELSPGEGVLQLSSEDTISLPDSLWEFFSFLTTPRRLSEVMSWIQEAGGSAKDVEDLLIKGYLRASDPQDMRETLLTFHDARLVLSGIVLEEKEDVVWLTQGGYSRIFPVSPLLLNAMMDQLDGEDFPQTISRLTQEDLVTQPERIRRCLLDLDILLGNSLAYFELISF